MNDTTIPAWFSKLIGEGLASLYLLCLEGCPAADTTPAVGRMWTQALWSSRKREWHEEADTACIRAAFAKIAETCHRWPAPAKFWECLPERRPFEGRSLPGRVFSMEERRENLRKLGELVSETLGKANG